MKKLKKIYLDYASSTPIDENVLTEMIPYFKSFFANTMSIHSLGREAKVILEKSRERVAGFICAKSKEIIFTSSATESNNFALKGIAFANKNKGNHIIVSSIEHESILKAAEFLEREGFKITRVKVNEKGIVDPKDIEKLIKKETILVSVIHANNEIGSIQPVSQIGRLCREKGVYFHVDAAQSFGKIAVNVNQMNVDLLTASSHKIYGPKGAAILYIKEGTKIEPLLHGGGHEMELRSSTVNLGAIVGFVKAVELCNLYMKEEFKRIMKLKEKFVSTILKSIDGVVINGDQKRCLPNIVNISFKGIEGEALAIKLDMEGICISTGSACSSVSLEPSHVLLAIGRRGKEARSAVRFSFGRFTSTEDINYTLKILIKSVKELRSRNYKLS
jgi:cysteine desulfurase